MKQGKYTQRMVTHIDESFERDVFQMVHYYGTNRSDLFREALEAMRNRWHQEVKAEQIDKVVQLELFRQAQNKNKA